MNINPTARLLTAGCLGLSKLISRNSRQKRTREQLALPAASIKVHTKNDRRKGMLLTRKQVLVMLMLTAKTRNDLISIEEVHEAGGNPKIRVAGKQAKAGSQLFFVGVEKDGTIVEIDRRARLS